MKDWYRQLGVTDSATEAEVRAALEVADASVREPAEFILLDPARRAVYDRNRRTLLTIGRLRANLGLNLTRFWPRARFADFTVDLAPPTPHGHEVDPATMAWAFGVRPAAAAASPLRRPRVRFHARRAAIFTAYAALLLALTYAAVRIWYAG